MIAGIRNFFTQMIEPAAAASGVAAEHALHLATAALLLETMRMDSSVAADETAAVAKALQMQFGLDAQQVGALMALAEEEARQATDYFQFTSLINKSFDAGQKARIIEYMWQVAFADGHLDAHEQHFMRKIADLLYVSHADYVAAKQRAREKA
ncbi:MAG: TerB family tellurite resistance protein [Sulfuritalea sp.]|nr:TerB family tellurite resistance protein [Sulfuritalea sp.]